MGVGVGVAVGVGVIVGEGVIVGVAVDLPGNKLTALQARDNKINKQSGTNFLMVGMDNLIPWWVVFGRVSSLGRLSRGLIGMLVTIP